MTARLEVIITPAALQQVAKHVPSEEERVALRTLLIDLAADPLLGYRIAFLEPTTYRIDAGRFRVHYRFDQSHIWVEFIGVY